MATQETAKTLYLTADGIKFAYRIIGSSSHNHSKPLLMLNHFRSNIDLWDPYLIDNFTSSGRQLITYDYAGHGHSGGTVATSVKGFAANLIAFLHILLPTLNTTSVDVLGFSLGGYVSQQTVLMEPSIFDKLILAGTGPSLGPGIQYPMAEVQSGIMSNPPNGNATIDAFFPSFIARDEGVAWISRSIAARSQIAGHNGEPELALFLSDPANLANLIEAYLTWNADAVPYSLLQTIQKDVLVTAGSNDLVVPTQNALVLARQLPRANLLMFPGSGHGHLFQYAKEFVNSANEFLDGKWPVPPNSAGSIGGLETV
jgi:pimeloyl-ACP methyl ester carboxylesterase